MKAKEKDVERNETLHTESEFAGYTMEELRYQRAMLALKKEFLKERAMEEVDAIKNQLPLVNGQMGPKLSMAKGIAGKLMKGLDMADYLMLGFQGFRIMRKVGTLFRRRK